jgi:HEAT repeat protein
VAAVLAEDADDLLRALAARALARVPGEAVFEPLGRALDDRSPRVRAAVAQALAARCARPETETAPDSGAPETASESGDGHPHGAACRLAAERLTGVLAKDPWMFVRAEAASALGAMCLPQTMAALLAASRQDPEDLVRRAATAARAHCP